MARFSSNLSFEELERMEREGNIGFRIPDNDTILNLAESQVQHPSISLSPNRSWLALYDSPKFIPFSQLAAEEVSVAGIRIHSSNFNKSRGRSYYNSLSLLDMNHARLQMNDKNSDSITPNISSIDGLPEDALFRSIKWSPDSNFLSFLLVVENEVQLWITDVKTKKAYQVTGNINASLPINSYIWKSNSRDLILLKASNKDKSIPKAPIPPFSPSIRSNLSGKKATARTYQNLLTSNHDENLFKFFCTSVVAKVSINEDGEKLSEEVYEPTNGIIQSFSVSPDGNYLFTHSIEEPFSYLVPYSRFPHVNQVWNFNTSPLQEIFKQNLPLQEQVPSIHDAVSIGPRYIGWIPTSDNTLYWVEAQDEGDPKNDVEIRDHLYTLSAPFTDEPELFQTFQSRFYDIDFCENGFVWSQERQWKNRWSKVYKIDIDNFKPISKDLIFDRSYEDVYNSPGSIWINKNSKGKFVIPFKDDKIILESPGATPDGYKPFLDRFDVKTKESTRIWRCEEGVFERVHILLEDDASQFLTYRESESTQPNIWMYSKDNDGNYQKKQLSNFPHPYPWLDDIKKEIVTYNRPDGVLLSGKLLLPNSFKVNEDAPLPMLIWAYPREYTSPEAANQVKIVSSKFTTITNTSPIYWATQGYAVLLGATMPIVSQGKKSLEGANDLFLEQLISNAETHVNEMVKRNIADPKRIAIAGHSYGAFMTANLLAHTNLFCAGIARSGTYNRSLTPFGFQSEDRTLWESGDLYYKLSPFNQAHKIKTPLLLIHGELDCNSGTYPEQSLRFYNALKGNGCITRLVMLPFEDHSYKSKENILHVLWETDYWLNTFVKNKE